VTDFLAIYLRDHHAAACAGAALAQRAADHATLGDERRGELKEVAGEIADDLKSLEKIMTSLGVTPNGVKDAVMRAAEKVGRLKLNGCVISRSPLSSVVELEGLLAGITSKQGMWRALQLLGDTRLEEAELRRLSELAHLQRELVDACRLEAAGRAFGAPAGALMRASTY
jgi:hypothetical protein